MPASVESTHAQYDAKAAQWAVMRHVSAGESAVKGAGEAYLPRLGGQENEQYAAYKMRASYYNATARTIDGLSGMVFRKPVMVDAPSGMDDFQADVTLDGIAFQGFAEQAVEEVLTVGRCGMLVDYPRVGDDGSLTQAEAARMNLRPFWSLYVAEAILDWRVGPVGNRTELMQVRLSETVSEAVEGDEFASSEIAQVRVLELTDEDSAALYYRQRVFRKSEATKEWEQYGEPVVPLMGGTPLTYIPFIFAGPRDTSAHVCKPPLLDLAQVNLSHYRTSADLEHGAHFTALPTPYLFGVREEERPTAIGPEAFWTSTNKDVTAGLLEFQGSGLEALEKRREVKEAQMASLGARMLAPEKRQAEAAETAAIHRQGEISILSSLSQAVSVALTQALEIARDWMQLTGEVSAELNRDYMPVPMTPQHMEGLFKMVQAGSISQWTFFDNLKRGEVINAGRTFEEEEAAREENGAGIDSMVVA